MLEALEACDTLILLLTRNVLHDPHCIAETYEALRLGKLVVPVNVDRCGYDYAAAVPWLDSLEAKMQQMPELMDQLSVLLPPGTCLADVQRTLRDAIPYVISINWQPHGGKHHTSSVVAEILLRIRSHKLRSDRSDGRLSLSSSSVSRAYASSGWDHTRDATTEKSGVTTGGGSRFDDGAAGDGGGAPHSRSITSPSRRVGLIGHGSTPMFLPSVGAAISRGPLRWLRPRRLPRELRVGAELGGDGDARDEATGRRPLARDHCELERRPSRPNGRLLGAGDGQEQECTALSAAGTAGFISSQV